MVTERFTAAIRVLFSTSAHVTYQQHVGKTPETIGFGKGGLKDLVLMSMALRKAYDNMLDASTEMATETGNLHVLQELRAVLDEMEKQNGRN